MNYLSIRLWSHHIRKPLQINTHAYTGRLQESHNNKNHVNSNNKLWIFYFITNNTNTNSKVQVQLPQIARKIFYFSKENLKKLHDTYSSNDPTDSWISTNDALVAHICRTATRARGIPLDEQFTCTFACDVRKKVNPPLPPNYFGNAGL